MHIAHVQTITRGFFAVDLHREHGQASGLLDLDLGGTGDLLQHGGHGLRGFFQLSHVITEDLDGHIAAHARDQLVEAQLNRLRELVVAARNLFHSLLYGSQQIVTRARRIGPLLTRPEHDVAIRNIRRHGVGGDLCSAGARKHTLDFRELLFELALDLHLHLHRLRKAGARYAQRLNRKVALIEIGCKLAAHARGQQQAQGNDDAGRRQHHCWCMHDLVQHRRIGTARPLHQTVFLLCHLLAHEQRNRGRDEGDRQQHGTQQRDHHRQRHGVEHLSFHTGKRKNGQIDHHDDELTEQQRTPCLPGCRKHFLETFAAGQRSACCCLGMGQTAHAVLHDHHRAINDDAEVQRPKAHQIGADAHLHHAREGEQHGQRNDERRDQRCPQIAQKQEQDRHDQRRPFDQVLLDRGNGLIHQIGAVVHRHGLHAGRQAFVDHLHALMHRLRHGTAVLANQHEHRTQHHFATVVRGSPRTQLATQAHIGQIAHANRLALCRAHDDFANIGNTPHLSRCADQILLALAFDIAGTHIGVVALQRCDDIGQREAIGRQLLRLGRHQIFLGEAANGIDLSHSRHIAQLGLDDPVLDLAQIHGCIG